LRDAVRELESSLAAAPVAGAARLQQQLVQFAGCLTEAEELWRTGRREGAESFRQELGRWGQRQGLVRAWIESNSSLVAGWAAAAGTGTGYGPEGRQAGAEPGAGASQSGQG
jgi:hypothetical protein